MNIMIHHIHKITVIMMSANKSTKIHRGGRYPPSFDSTENYCRGNLNKILVSEKLYPNLEKIIPTRKS